MTHDIVLKIVLTAVGVLTTAAITYTGRQIIHVVSSMRDVAKNIERLDSRIANIESQNVTQSNTLCKLINMQQPNIRALRSMCFSMREAGFNGSIKNAFDHINDWENKYNDTTDDNNKIALGAK